MEVSGGGLVGLAIIAWGVINLTVIKHKGNDANVVGWGFIAIGLIAMLTWGG
jgi:hypothetical protein